MKNSGLFVSATKWKKGRNASRPKTTSAASPSAAGISAPRSSEPNPRPLPAANALVITRSGATARS